MYFMIGQSQTKKLLNKFHFKA